MSATLNLDAGGPLMLAVFNSYTKTFAENANRLLCRELREDIENVRDCAECSEYGEIEKVGLCIQKLMV